MTALRLDCATLLPADFPRTDDLRLDFSVVAFAAIVTGLAGIVCGLMPALRIRRLDLVSSLAENGSTPLEAGNSSQTVRVRLLLMIGQVAAASLLLVGAALLGRSFVETSRPIAVSIPVACSRHGCRCPRACTPRNAGTLYSRRWRNLHRGRCDRARCGHGFVPRSRPPRRWARLAAGATAVNRWRRADAAPRALEPAWRACSGHHVRGGTSTGTTRSRRRSGPRTTSSAATFPIASAVR
jgi:hypothetical protein